MTASGVDLERLMEQMARFGVTMILKTDHERMLEGRKPWTIIMSGSGMGPRGGIHTDKDSLEECLKYGLGEVRLRHEDWDWLDEFDVS